MIQIDKQKLIREVEKRPGLYDQSNADYNSVKRKKILWEEIYQELIGDEWGTISEADREAYRKKIQRKWNSLRDSFRRELRIRSGLTNANRRSRRYYFYDDLLFLLPFSQNVIKNPEAYYEESNDDEENNEIEEMNLSEQSVDIEEYPVKMIKREVNNLEYEVHVDPIDTAAAVPTAQEVNCTDNKNDDDIAFLNSLLPSFRELTTEQKLGLRIEVMQTVLNFIQKSKKS